MTTIIDFLKGYPIWKKVCIDGQILDFNNNLNYSKVTKIALQDLSEKMHTEISKELSKYSSIYYSKSHAAHKPGFLTMDISNIESTKQEAIHYVIMLLKLKKEETIGIGDSYNDFPLLMACGLKVAMGNSVPELKAIADFVAPPVEEDGVSHTIEKFILDR